MTKLLISLSLLIGWSANAGAADLTVKGKLAKPIYKALEDLAGVRCEGRRCQVEIGFSFCQSFAEPQTAFCYLQVKPGLNLVVAIDENAAKLYDSFAAAGVEPMCELGVCAVSVGQASCTRQKQFFGSRYVCEIDL